MNTKSISSSNPGVSVICVISIKQMHYLCNNLLKLYREINSKTMTT